MFFDDHATVTIGGVQASSVSVASPTVLNATTGPHAAGLVDVVVTNPDGQKGTLAGAYTYSGPPPPVITAAAIAGKNLVVSGENFDGGAVLLVNGIGQKTIDVDMGTVIGKKVAKQLPVGQAVMLQVRNSDGNTSAAFPFSR
jgi:hypothetical protein